MARREGSEEYDWLDDPFDERKAAREREQARGMSSGSKGLVGCGCVLMLVGSLVLVALLVSAGAALSL